MQTEMYRLSDVITKLRACQAPVATGEVTCQDVIRKDIVDVFVEYVEQSFSHKNYDEKNLHIVANINLFTAHLHQEKWPANVLAAKTAERDHLVDTNKLVCTQLGLKTLATSSNDFYLMDPFTERDIKVAIDFDETRATGGTCHAATPELGYKIIDFSSVSAKGYVTASITEEQYIAWRKELVGYLKDKDIASIRLKHQEMVDKRAETVNTVNEFISNWATKRADILELKQSILEQRLLEHQIKKIKTNNEGLISTLKRRHGGDSEDSSGILADVRMGPRGLGPDRIIDQEAKDLPEDEEDESNG